ncbi:hypothetical protein DFH09DRAFT_1090112 [Mycena vulgaris]|nr:hypothetical protein DFH09DRAFT_1090112 [Mycena vulgaris]
MMSQMHVRVRGEKAAAQSETSVRQTNRELCKDMIGRARPLQDIDKWVPKLLSARSPAQSKKADDLSRARRVGEWLNKSSRESAKRERIKIMLDLYAVHFGHLITAYILQGKEYHAKFQTKYREYRYRFSNMTHREFERHLGVVDGDAHEYSLIVRSCERHGAGMAASWAGRAGHRITAPATWPYLVQAA